MTGPAGGDAGGAGAVGGGGGLRGAGGGTATWLPGAAPHACGLR